MVRTSVLHDALKNINNAEKAGKRQVMIRPSSKVIIKFLSVMQKHGKSGKPGLDSFPSLLRLPVTLHTTSQFGMITGRRSQYTPTTLVF